MPRLVNIGPGEIIDRLTILLLKILYGSQRRREVKHFETERNALLVMLRGRTLDGSWFEQALALAMVNAAIWQAEDELRAHREQAGTVEKIGGGDPTLRDISTVAFRIQELNDQRAELVEMINKQTGDHLGSEKLT